MVKSQVLSSERKTEQVREDAIGDREDGKEEDDDMPCVIGDSEGDCVFQELLHVVFLFCLFFCNVR